MSAQARKPRFPGSNSSRHATVTSVAQQARPVREIARVCWPHDRGRQAAQAGPLPAPARLCRRLRQEPASLREVSGHARRDARARAGMPAAHRARLAIQPPQARQARPEQAKLILPIPAPSVVQFRPRRRGQNAERLPLVSPGKTGTWCYARRSAHQSTLAKTGRTGTRSAAQVVLTPVRERYPLRTADQQVNKVIGGTNASDLVGRTHHYANHDLAVAGDPLPMRLRRSRARKVSPRAERRDGA